MKKNREDAVGGPVMGGDIVTRNTEVTVEITPARRCIVNTAAATHIGTRDYQQDAVYVSEPLFEEGLSFAVLCDGMGGTEEGERASSDVVAFLANSIAALGEQDDIPSFFEAVAAGANEMVLEQNRISGKNAGTTLVSALIRQNELFWLGVGDSRIYILRGEEFAQVSRDHSFALELQDMVEAGQITPQQAVNDPRREALISYIGAPVLEIVDVNSRGFLLEYGDIVLLCSDGLTKALPDEEISTILRAHGGDLSGAARSLTLAAFDASVGAMDNTSVILMQYLL